MTGRGGGRKEEGGGGRCDQRRRKREGETEEVRGWRLRRGSDRIRGEESRCDGRAIITVY